MTDAAALSPGLFGKLPAHGDFVARGWDAATQAAVDGWLTAGVAAVRDAAGEAGFAAAMTAGPLWHLWLPQEGGRAALHGVLAPTVDAAGRYFMLLAGVAGDADAVWAAASQHPGFVAEVEAAAYDALAGALDADALLGRVAAAVPALDWRARFLGGLSMPGEAVFWVPDPVAGAPLAIRAAALDAALVERLVGVGVDAA